ncbi:transposase [Peptostreptococcus anaerobius]|uniref:IS256 family transposase n=1 Tax=Peptostreptococcus anaerobius TaxID=1261 RepID=UPI002ED3D204
MRNILGLYVGDAESSKYWLSVFNELKNRGLKDIMIICADGLTGIKESINVAFPNTEYQRCIVHQVRNTLKYVSYKNKKEFAADLKSIYLSGSEEQARQNLDAVSEKWSEKYPNSLKSWYTNWDCIIPIFKFSPETRRVIYTTNAIESLNAQFKRLNRNRSVFPTKSSLEKALFLSVEKITYTQILQLSFSFVLLTQSLYCSFPVLL